MASGTNRCIYNEVFINNLSNYIRELLDYIDLYFTQQIETDNHNSLRFVMILKNSILEQYHLINNSFSNYSNSKLTNNINKSLNSIYESITEIGQYIKISRGEMYTNPLSKFKVMKDIEDMKQLYCLSHKQKVYNGGRKTRNGRKHRKATRKH